MTTTDSPHICQAVGCFSDAMPLPAVLCGYHDEEADSRTVLRKPAPEADKKPRVLTPEQKARKLARDSARRREHPSYVKIAEQRAQARSAVREVIDEIQARRNGRAA